MGGVRRIRGGVGSAGGVRAEGLGCGRTENRCVHVGATSRGLRMEEGVLPASRLSYKTRRQEGTWP